MEAGSTPRGAGSGHRGGRERAAGPAKQRTESRHQSGASLQAAGHRQPRHRGRGAARERKGDRPSPQRDGPLPASGQPGSSQGAASDGTTPARQKSKKPNVFKKKMDPPFEEYWTKEDVQRGLKLGDLIQGALRINPRNYEEAFMDDPDGGPDYYVKGVLSRNRALERDVVVIQVLPPEKWETEERLQAITDAEASRPDPVTSELLPTPAATKLSGDHTTGPHVAKTAPEQPPLPEVLQATLVDRLYTVPAELQVRGQEEDDEGRGKGNDILMYRRTAKVVYIVEKVHSRACAGFLKAFDRERGQALFSPKDSKIPRVIVPLRDCPKDYPQNPKKFENTLFICRIKQWDRDSPFPHGELLRSMGEAGEIEPETESFLIENEIDFTEFSPEVLECLPQDKPWSIPQEEEARRRDFRTECIFSIDPETARDLDDALHVKEVEEGVYEVGVHIADVSYFVKPDTALDQAASSRATSVYLVQRVIPMLPRLLCEELCSLNPNEDRLAFSVVWKMTIHGEFLDEWMGRSIIRSCAKLSYSHAQAMIEDPGRDWMQDELPAISNSFSASQVSTAVNTLNRLAKALKSQRLSKGTLRLDQPKLKLTLSQETGLPNGCDVYSRLESHSLIEEFMLLANMAVAHKIWKAHPQLAMLRRHPSPKEKACLLLMQKCHKLGIELDTSSAASIQQSLDQYCGSGGDGVMEKMVLVSLCSKTMELARYFCTGSVEKEADFLHYALNVPRYTHFTSPIRRYADIVVHRQLASALDEGPPFSMLEDHVTAQAEHCNKKKKSAKIVEELSIQMFFAIFIRECSPIQEKGIVIQVLDKAFDVLVERYGVIKRIYCEQLPLLRFQPFQEGKTKLPSLVLEWSGPDGSTLKQELTVMSIVDVVLTGSSRPLQYEAKIVPPS